MTSDSRPRLAARHVWPPSTLLKSAAGGPERLNSEDSRSPPAKTVEGLCGSNQTLWTGPPPGPWLVQRPSAASIDAGSPAKSRRTARTNVAGTTRILCLPLQEGNLAEAYA